MLYDCHKKLTEGIRAELLANESVYLSQIRFYPGRKGRLTQFEKFIPSDSVSQAPNDRRIKRNLAHVIFKNNPAMRLAKQR